jgi:hypothetical protein
MKKPSGKILTVLFVTGFIITSAVFAAYHICRANCPAVKEFFDSSALDTNAITAYFTALAFVGFVITSVYQAHCNAVTEQELEEEKRRNKKTPTRFHVADDPDRSAPYIHGTQG